MYSIVYTYFHTWYVSYYNDKFRDAREIYIIQRIYIYL